MKAISKNSILGEVQRKQQIAALLLVLIFWASNKIFVYK